jgi:hypothetical protein
MKIGDLIKWESVQNDDQEEFMQCYDQEPHSPEYINKALIQFHDELVWLPLNSIEIIDEQ